MEDYVGGRGSSKKQQKDFLATTETKEALLEKLRRRKVFRKIKIHHYGIFESDAFWHLNSFGTHFKRAQFTKQKQKQKNFQNWRSSNSNWNSDFVKITPFDWIIIFPHFTIENSKIFCSHSISKGNNNNKKKQQNKPNKKKPTESQIFVKWKKHNFYPAAPCPLWTDKGYKRKPLRMYQAMGFCLSFIVELCNYISCLLQISPYGFYKAFSFSRL